MGAKAPNSADKERTIKHERTITMTQIEKLIPIENEGKRILLTSQLAELYGTTTDTITKNFNRNRERYTEGADFYCLEGEKLKAFKTNGQIDLSLKLNKLYLWTEHGALLHAKSLGTNEAWKIYGDLVDTYFKVQEQKKLPTQSELLLKQVEILVGIEKDVTTLKGAVDTLEERIDKQITLDCGKQRTLQRAIASRACERAAICYPKAIPQNKGKFFQALHRDIKNCFGVASYRDISITDYADAIAYIGAWIEPAEVRNEVS